MSEMAPESAELLLRILIENVSRVLDNYFGVDRAEPTLVQIAELVIELPHLKGKLLERIDITIQNYTSSHPPADMVSHELVEFIAHEFRWPEIGESLARRLATVLHGDPSLGRGDIYSKVLDALQDDWDGREFYRRYRNVIWSDPDRSDPDRVT